MKDMPVTVHGGDLETIEKFYKIPKNKIKDFSGNINPYGIPLNVTEHIASNLDLLSTYPDTGYERLRRSIAAYVHADYENILVGNGVTELLSHVIKLYGRGKTLIIGPAYSEYEREVSIAGGQAEYFELREDEGFRLDINRLEERLSVDIGLLILCNPNNPTGTAVEVDLLDRLLSGCKQKGIFVLVDETYIEFTNEESFSSIPLASRYENLFVTRGVSKFFAAPGLRLGYGICADAAVRKRISDTRDPWSVNTLCSVAGEVMFGNKDYISATKAMIAEQREHVLKTLSEWKQVKAYDTEANFMLFRLTEDALTQDRKIITATDVFEHLIRKHMLIRNASSFTFLDERYLRFCFLLPEDNSKMLDVLHSLFTFQ